MAKRNNRRSPHAQIAAMRRQWPQFNHQKTPDGLLIWRGVLRPKAQPYLVMVVWKTGLFDRPHAFILQPRIRPRPGGIYAEIPHLMFNEDHPEWSALCLFDPDGKEWCESDLIADTTIDWVSEWLLYYELWHLTGRWLGRSVGYESVAQIRAAQATAIREAAADVH